jgi:hypothetical protein
VRALDSARRWRLHNHHFGWYASGALPIARIDMEANYGIENLESST